MNCLLTIDFEDFSYDFLTKGGVNAKHRILALEKSYLKIKQLINSSEGSKECTFFCTGNVAKYASDLIKEISNDGHEVACHSYRHVDISKLNEFEFEKDIHEAITSLSKACGKGIKGYRAPMFSLGKDDLTKYKILSKYFEYDSSLVLEGSELNKYVKDGKYPDLDLKCLPIFKLNEGFLHKRVIGGTYLKISSTENIIKNLKKAKKASFEPMIYMHPYEFDNAHDFWVKMSDMDELNISFLKKIYFQFRQHQWHSFNNLTI